MIIENLRQLRNIGLTEGEIKVYGALLELGETTKTALAKTASISPANLYDITNRMSEKGIISIITKNGIKHFSPANPRQLLQFLEQKKQEIHREEASIIALLPALQAAYEDQRSNTSTEIFSGWNGLKTIFEDMIIECTEKDICLTSGASEGERGSQADRFFLKYSKMRAKKGIELNIIFNTAMKKRKERIEFFLSSKKCMVRFLDQNTLSETMIYRDTTVIITLTAEPTAIRIRSQEITNSFRQQFHILWESAKKD